MGIVTGPDSFPHLSSQMLRCRGLQQREFIHKAAEQGEGRTNLRLFPKARLFIKKQGRLRGWGVWGKVIGERCGYLVLHSCN